MKYDYDISFVTINYNGIVDTCELIDSLVNNLRNVTFEIIVVDNASSNSESKKIKEKYPEIEVISSKENLGFAGGNNLALPFAHGRYVMFINNDTFVEKDEFRNLINRIESDSCIGMVCPKIRFSWGKRPIQFAGFTPLSLITLRNKGIGCYEEDKGQYETAHPTPFAHGAAMLVKRDILEKVGPMWEGYFLYYEEMDWSEQITNAGYQIWYEPSCTIFHKESKAVGIGSPTKNYYLTRNRLLFAKRNRKGITRYACYLYLTVVPLLFHAPKYAVTGKFKHACNIVKALKDFYL